jgi:hypothetical protein
VIVLGARDLRFLGLLPAVQASKRRSAVSVPSITSSIFVFYFTLHSGACRIESAGQWNQEAFHPYVEERLERMRRLRITARLAVTLRSEFGEAARLRRQRAGHRMRVDKMLSPVLAAIMGPERLPAAAFEQATIDALLAP